MLRFVLPRDLLIFALPSVRESWHPADEGLGLREDRLEIAIEAPRCFPSQLDVRQLVFADRHELRTRQEDVRDLHHGIDVEGHRTDLPFVAESSGFTIASISARNVGLRSSMPTGRSSAWSETWWSAMRK